MARQQKKPAAAAAKKPSSPKPPQGKLPAKKSVAPRPAAPKPAAATPVPKPSVRKSPADKPPKALAPASERPQRQDLGKVVKPPASERGNFRWLAAPPAAAAPPVAISEPVAPVAAPPETPAPPPAPETPATPPVMEIPARKPDIIPAVIPESPAPVEMAPPVTETTVTPPLTEAKETPVTASVFIPEPSGEAIADIDKLASRDAATASIPPASELEREWKVANDRVNWALTAQAILIVAFCVIPGRTGDRTAIQTTLLCVIPLIALAINIAGLTSLIAVQIIIQKRKAEQGTPPGPSTTEGRLEQTRKLGFVISLAIMAILTGLWLWFLGSIAH